MGTDAAHSCGGFAIDKNSRGYLPDNGTAARTFVILASSSQTVKENIGRACSDGVNPVAGKRTASWVRDSGSRFAGHFEHPCKINSRRLLHKESADNHRYPVWSNGNLQHQVPEKARTWTC